MKKIVDSFVVGGTASGTSLPGTRLQQMLGSRIEILFGRMQLAVPTQNGIIIANRGDRIVLYDDDTLEVEH